MDAVNLETLAIVPPEHPALRAIAEEVTDENYVYAQELALNMIALMAEHNGVGLSAPQVGVSLRVFVMLYYSAPIIVINPKITNTGSERVTANEGCLTWPGALYAVERFRVIDVEFMTTKRRGVRTTLKGIAARIFQHEYDHLQGICLKQP